MMPSPARNTLIRTLSVGAFLASLCVLPAHAQPTNVEVFEQLATECLSDELPEALIVDASEARPYVRSAVVSHLLETGRRVYGADAEIDSLSVLTVREEDPRIGYERERRGIRRSASMALRTSLRMPDGRLATDEACTRSYSDRVDRREIARLENPNYPETSAPVPAASWRRRYVEPIIMAGATAVTVLLFFSLRSKRATTE